LIFQGVFFCPKIKRHKKDSQSAKSARAVFLCKNAHL